MRSPPGGSRGRTGWPPERGWGPVPQPGGQQVELFAQRSWGADPNPALALIRDGNGTRSFETLLRYRGAAMAEFMRALRTLKALQAEQAAEAGPDLEAHPERRATRPPLVDRPQPDEPERAAARRLQYLVPGQPLPGRTLHEPAAPWLPNEPEPRQHAVSPPARPDRVPNQPDPRRKVATAPARPDLVPNQPEPHRVR